jgi:hypothetical protein
MRMRMRKVVMEIIHNSLFEDDSLLDEEHRSGDGDDACTYEKHPLTVPVHVPKEGAA